MPDQIFFAVLAAAYAFVIGVGSWLVMANDRKQRWQNRFHKRLLTMRATARGWRISVETTTGRIPAGVSHATHLLRRRMRQYRHSLLIGMCLLCLPAVVLQLLAPTVLESYEDLPPAIDPVVLGLLQGEQLSSPPSLPPELFITPEVQAERQEINTASREWRLLDAEFRQRLLTVYRLMATHGYEMALLEGYRSPERQRLLATLGAHVTNAAAFQSYHQYGLAADSAFYRNGKIVIKETDPWAMEGYRLYGQYAESVGLVWGGRWKMRDFGHVELRKPGVRRGQQ